MAVRLDVENFTVAVAIVGPERDTEICAGPWFSFTWYVGEVKLMHAEVSRMVSVDVLRLPSTFPKLGLLSVRLTVSSPSQDVPPLLMIGITKVVTIWPGPNPSVADGGVVTPTVP